MFFDIHVPLLMSTSCSSCDRLRNDTHRSFIFRAYDLSIFALSDNLCFFIVETLILEAVCGA